MPRPSPFYERMLPLCESMSFKDWAGYLAPSRYDVNPIYEYTAFRKSAGLIDVTPLFKYEITGKDAAAFLSRVCVRGFTKMKVGRVAYTCWCDDDGKVVDDGTVTRFAEDQFFLTAAEPQFRWLDALTRGYDVTIKDVSEKIGALALQGPTSRDILKDCCDADLDALAYFGATAAKLHDFPVRISRTGYTGDLGYEVWCDNADALHVWDAIMAAGKHHGIRAVGIEALDMVRVEAGYIMAGVDYSSAPSRILDSQKSSPFEIGLTWTMKLDRKVNFVGKEALCRERDEKTTPWKLVGIEWSWEEIEALYASYGLPPGLHPEASRTSVPLWLESAQVGYITSSTWSPLLKRQIGMGFVRPQWADLKTELQVEHTVEYERRSVRCQVVEMPFFDPKRKRE